MKVLSVIAQNGYQDNEYDNSRAELEKAGIEVEVASLRKEIAKGKLGGEVEPDYAIENVSADDYDGILVVGGPGALSLVDNPNLVKLLNLIKNDGKVIAAICIAPVILAKAGLLKDVKATVWNGDNMQAPLIERYGASYTGQDVTVDGKIVTANGPNAAVEFGQKIADLINKKL